MKNEDKWNPSKYIYKKGKLIASRDRKEVQAGSRLPADLIAEFYDQALKNHVSGKLLDLGCGKVPLYQAYKDHIKENICVDWENTRHKNEYLDFNCDLTKQLPFKNDEFDTIILSDVLEHIPQPEKLWKELFRILSNKGKLIMNVPFFYCLHELPHDYYRYTEYALKKFVRDSGLNLVQFSCIGGSPEVFADILSKHLQFIPFMGVPLSICIQYMTKIFIQTSFGKKVSEKTSEAFPFGYFLIAEKRL
jgi:SAM-dependent methyltransferase